MLDYLDLASLETKTIADGNEIITKGVSIKINENMNINEIILKLNLSKEKIQEIINEIKNIYFYKN